MNSIELQTSTLPAWLAHPYASARGDLDPGRQYKSALETWEALLEYACVVLASAYIEGRQQAQNPKLDRALAAHFGKRSAMGDWEALLWAFTSGGDEWVQKLLGATEADLAFTAGAVLELFGELQSRRPKVRLKDLLVALVRLRNEFSHSASDTVRQGKLQDLLMQAFDDVVSALPGLKKWQLCYINRHDRIRQGTDEVQYCVISGNVVKAAFQKTAVEPGGNWFARSLVVWDLRGAAIAVPEWLASYDADSNVLNFLQGTDGHGERLIFHTRMGQKIESSTQNLRAQLHHDLPLLREPLLREPPTSEDAVGAYRALFRKFLRDDGVVDESEVAPLAVLATLGKLTTAKTAEIEDDERAIFAQMSAPPAPSVPESPPPAGPAPQHSLSWLIPARARLGVSQGWGAAQAGLSARTFSKWERDLSQPDPTQLELVEAALAANWLERARVVLGWSQEQVAAQAGVSRGTVSSWENARSVPAETQRRLLLDKVAPAFAAAACRRLGDVVVPTELRIASLSLLCDRLDTLTAVPLDGPQGTPCGTVAILKRLGELAEVRLAPRFDGELVCSEASPWLLFRKADWQSGGCEYGVAFSTEAKIGGRPLDKFSCIVGIGVCPLGDDSNSVTEEEHRRTTRALVDWLIAHWPEPGVHGGVPLPADPKRALSQENRWWALWTAAQYPPGTDPTVWTEEVLDRLDGLAGWFVPSLDGFAVTARPPPH